MGENSKISWCDHTFNGWIGCQKVSSGCINCYAERDFDHRFGKAKWGPLGTRVLTSRANWQKPSKWNNRAKENGTVETVFTASLSDVFEYTPREALMDLWRDELFKMMEQTPWLVWLVLTKRPENVMGMVPARWRTAGWWPQNVWVGFSAEDQGNFDLRLEMAREIPTPVLWVSAEPLLGPIDISENIGCGWPIHWLIAGGESGPNARPMHPTWVRQLRDQCGSYHIPFHFKQYGEWVPQTEVNLDHNIFGKYWTDNGELLLKVGRKNAPETLDGSIYHDYPNYLHEYEESLKGEN